jgi:hypothetical protein
VVRDSVAEGPLESPGDSGIRGRASSASSEAARRLQQPLDLRDDLEQVPDQADVGHLKMGASPSLLMATWRASLMPVSAGWRGDADGDVQLRADPAGLTHLHLVGRVAGIDRRT